ncbi:hypothetical protein Hypma_004583 [Hypsizygus marmoreus]|uniref:GDP-fucose protein O-fucosyltransferase 2 n=1 Tax=Hypsizygus marmoreus TaxID=39966 RepID=A0A369K334_HYPMA|nr:hypothetical protein Hypma_004583 [Hypsizygus marmoreus]
MPRTILRDRRWDHLSDPANHIRSRGKGLPLPYGSKPRRRGFSQLLCRSLPSPRIILCLALIASLLIFKVLASGIPSTYQDIRKFERSLPQHDLTEALRKGTLYLRVPKHVSGRGFNNVLQESLLLSYLALQTRRAFVFEEYMWSRSPLPYTLYDFALRPSRMPLNAFVSGPIAGGHMPSPYSRAVSAEFWETVCPPESRHIISSADQPSDADGIVILDWWIERLEGIRDRCVEIDSEKIIFDFLLFGDTRVLSLWQGLSDSPILKEFRWSSLVQSAIHHSLPIIDPASFRVALHADPSSTLSGLVAVHLRRGDFKGHCQYLIRYNALYMGFNRFPEMLDKFTIPNERRKENLQQYYLEHCFPDVDQIVEKLRQVRAANPGLKRVYALTNGKASWMSSLKRALQEDGWRDVKSSLDLKLDSAQKHVAMAVDMAIAEKAEVFIGNGFSSLTANVVVLRMAKGLASASNRLL